jgi:LIM domain-containing protein
MNYVPLGRASHLPLSTGSIVRDKSTVRVLKSSDDQATVSNYYGQCCRCRQTVIGASNACQAMGDIYHNRCFRCCRCNRILREKTFYCVDNQIYCEEDYLASEHVSILKRMKTASRILTVRLYF